jgi:hypothetical protein
MDSCSLLLSIMGGCFIGSGINREYRGGVIDMYDYCESDKWYNICYISYFENFQCTYLSATGSYLKFL